MREQLPLISLCIAVLAFLVSYYPQGTFLTPRRLSPEQRMMVADSIQSDPLPADLQLTEEAKVKKLEEKVQSLSRKMDRLASDYQALSEWTMEQLVAIEASKNNSQWDDESDTYDNSPEHGSYRPDSTDGSYRAGSTGYDDSPAHKTASTPVRAIGNWQQNQFQSAMAAINLFPQQVEPVRVLFDEAMDKNINQLAQLKESGTLTRELIQQVRDEVRIDLQNKLSSIVTPDQMEDFSSLYKRKNRYETASGSAGNLPSGNNSSTSVQTHGLVAFPTGDTPSQDQTVVTSR